MTPPQSPTPYIAPACPNCGLPDTDRQDFCPSCGEYLRWDEYGGPPRPAPAPPPLPPAPVAAPAQPEPAETVQPVLLVLDGGRPTVTVAPGGRASLAGLLRNQSGVVDNSDVRVAGVPAAWTTPPPTAYLLPFGSGDEHEQRFEVVLAPPRAAEAEARSWPLAIEVVSRSRGAVVARAHATLEILPFHEVSMRARPQKRRSRRSARFAVELESRGNAPATVALSAADGGDGASVSLDPPSVQLPAGGRATTRLRVTPRRTIWWGRPEEHRIEVSAAVASGEAGASPPPQTVTLRQLPWIPWWVPVALFALIALLIALLALRGEQVVVPEVRGETVEVAQQRLVEAGLEGAPRVQEVIVADQGQIGRVLQQNPAPGEEIDSDDAVLLQADGANQIVSVPDIRGATRDDAQRILAAAGLTLGAIEPGDAPGDATVDFQNPAAGDQARLGGPVNVILVDAEEPAEDEEAEQAPDQEQEGADPGHAGEGTAGRPDAVNEVQP
jgi:PASTA domain